MKFKLDENIGQRGYQLFKSKGFDVATVTGQGLNSASDWHLIDVCQKEKRCLVSLDLDFSNPLVFKPSEYSGIAVLRLPKRPTPDDLAHAVTTLLDGVSRESIDGQLWIIQAPRIRIYSPEPTD